MSSKAVNSEYDYEILESRVLEPGEGLSQGSFINRISEGRTGKIFTTIANLSGLSTDSGRLSDYYSRNSEVIEGYFNLIDREKVLSLAGDDIKTFLEQNTPPLVIGFGAGMATLWLIRKLTGK